MSGAGPRVGVVGAGYWGKNIVRNAAALGVLAAVVDSEAASREAVAAAFPGTPLCDSFAELIARPDIDGVMIATPAATHGALVADALAAGKHVFVEKPLCLEIDEARRLNSEAERRGLVLMVGHLLLYHPAFEALKAAVDDGAVGKLRYIYSNRLSLGKIRREETVLWSFAPHDISMILQLTGRLPQRVTTRGGHFLSPGIADTTMTYMEFDGDLQAHIFVSWLHPYKDQRLVVVGDEAMAVFNDVALGPEKLMLYRHRAGWDGETPVIAKAEGEPLAYDAQAEPLRRECEAFLKAVAGVRRPPSDAAEGIRVLTVLDASTRALKSGGVVEINARPKA